MELKSAFRRNFYGSKRLNCFRLDTERTRVNIPDDNLDLSQIYGFGALDENMVFLASSRLVNFVSHYDQVNTNRLHIALAAALLGKSVNFHPNSYFKNESVYRHSMSVQFPVVKWNND